VGSPRTFNAAFLPAGTSIPAPARGVLALATVLGMRRLVAPCHLSLGVTRGDLEVSEACLGQVREHFTEAEIVGLTFIIGFQTFASKFAKAWRLAPQGYFS
jgi:hypothetical protein